MRISDWSSDVALVRSAANALDALIPTIVQKISDDANGGSVFTTVSEIGLVQDAANIISCLDWRLSQAGAAQVFNELSSAEIYGSLAAIEQNSALTESFETAAAIGSNGVWINSVGRFERYGDTNSAASKRSQGRGCRKEWLGTGKS